MKWLIIVFKLIFAAIAIFFGLGLLLTLLKPLHESLDNEASLFFAVISLIAAIYLFAKVSRKILKERK